MSDRYREGFDEGIACAARFCDGMQVGLVTDSKGNEKPFPDKTVTKNKILSRMAKDILELQAADHWFHN